MNNKPSTYNTTCGQACVGVILDIPLRHSIELFGHANPTTSKDIKEALELCGITSRKLKKIDRELDNTKIAIIKKYMSKYNSYHWVLKYYDKVYDPEGSIFYKYNSYCNGFGFRAEYMKVNEDEVNKSIQARL